MGQLSELVSRVRGPALKAGAAAPTRIGRGGRCWASEHCWARRGRVMVRRRNQSNNRRAQVHSGQDPIHQIQNARAAILSFLRKRVGDDGVAQALIYSGHGKVPPFEEVADNLCSCVYTILPSLRPSHEELIRRIDLGGESSKTVAQDLAMTRNNVRVRLHRARQVLRARLVSFCGRCCERDCRDCWCDVSAFPTMKSQR